jgi:hypothetical protein
MTVAQAIEKLQLLPLDAVLCFKENGCDFIEYRGKFGKAKVRAVFSNNALRPGIHLFKLKDSVTFS